jgi:hypothetical protein
VSGILFTYPSKARLDRPVPKSRIYESGEVRRAVRDRFVRQVAGIVWEFSLSPRTTNIPEGPGVPEVQVFRVDLKEPDLDPNILRAIDEAIPSPLVLELVDGDRMRMAMAWKRPHLTDAKRWIVGEHFLGPWMGASTPRQPLPPALTLRALQEHLLRSLLPFPARVGETLEAQLDRIETLRAREKQVEATRRRLHKEGQFNRKVAIHSELQAQEAALEDLSRLGTS